MEALCSLCSRSVGLSGPICKQFHKENSLRRTLGIRPPQNAATRMAVAGATVAQLSTEKVHHDSEGEEPKRNRERDEPQRRGRSLTLGPVMRAVREAGVVALAGSADLFSVTDMDQILKELGRAGDWQRAVEVFNWMLEDRYLQPDERTYTVMIDLLGRHQQVQMAEALFSDMKSEGLGPDVKALNAMMSVYVRNSMAEEALALLSRARNDRVQLDLVTYGVAMGAAEKADAGVARMLQIFQQMVADGIRPNVYVFRPLISALGKEDRNQEAAAVFNTMQESGVEPDVATWTAMIGVYVKAGLVEEAEECIHKMQESGITPSTTTYNILIDLYRRAKQTAKAAAAFKRMQELGICPNEVTFNTMISAYGRANRPQEAADLLTVMQEHNIRPSEITYSTLLGAYSRAGQADSAREILNKMQANKLKIETWCWRDLINAYVRAGEIRTALKLLEDMQEKELPVEKSMYTSLLSALIKSGDFEEMKSVAKKITSAGFEPETSVCRNLLDAARETKSAESAIYVLEMAKGCGQADLQMYNHAMRTCQMAGDLKATEDLFDEIPSSNLTPDATSYSVVMDAFSDKRRLEDAEELFQEATADSAAGVEVYNSMIRAYGLNAKPLRAETVVKRMKEEGCNPNTVTYNMLVLAHVKSQNATKAAEAVRAMQQAGLQPDSYTYRALAQVDRLALVQNSKELEDLKDLLKELGPFATAKKGGSRSRLSRIRDKT